MHLLSKAVMLGTVSQQDPTLPGGAEDTKATSRNFGVPQERQQGQMDQMGKSSSTCWNMNETSTVSPRRWAENPGGSVHGAAVLGRLSFLLVHFKVFTGNLVFFYMLI